MLSAFYFTNVVTIVEEYYTGIYLDIYLNIICHFESDKQ